LDGGGRCFGAIDVQKDNAEKVDVEAAFCEGLACDGEVCGCVDDEDGLALADEDEWWRWR